MGYELGQSFRARGQVNQSSWMSLGEAARLLGVHPSTLRIWADRGEIPSHRTPGGHRRFRLEELSAWSAAHRAGQIDKAQGLWQSVLDQTRLQSTEGRFEGEAWFRRLSENGKGRLRELGQRTLVALAQSPGSLRPEGEITLITLGQQYAELLNAEGLALEEGCGPSSSSGPLCWTARWSSCQPPDSTPPPRGGNSTARSRIPRTCCCWPWWSICIPGRRRDESA